MRITIKKKKPQNNKKKLVIKKPNKKHEFMTYPDITDPEFYEKIYLKKEFRDHVIPKQTKKIEELCAPGEFKLAPQQEFLRNFISVDTPYNGLLIFHGTGVGKTCAAVSIAEGFKEVMSRLHLGEERKILVILPRQIKDNFKKDIYDYDKETRKKYPDDIVQCTGNTYTLDYDTYKSYTLSQKLKEINKRINNNYAFMGYEQFANDVMLRTNWDGKTKNLTSEIIQRIKTLFSNRIMIIDEVHNVKSSAEDEFKKVPPILEAVVRNADNMRLVLMSATPMYDSASELVYVLNLLLANDKRKTIKTADIFNKDNQFVDGGEELLRNLARGYVSYLRGENPVTFPQKVFPSFATVPDIKFDIKGQEIPKDDRLKYTKLTMCKMDPFQYVRYKSLLNLAKNINNNNVNIEKEEQIINRMQPLIHASNIVYVNKNDDLISMKKEVAYPKSDDGKGAFIRTEKMGTRIKKKYMQFQYQSHLIFDKGTKNEKPFLDEDHVHKYSAKYSEALNIIKRSTGIIYIYSQFIWAGVLPFALMLEQNGIGRYVTEGEKPLLDYSRNKMGGGGTRDDICYLCGNTREFAEHKEDHKNYHKFRWARYIILTASQEINKIESNVAVNVINQSNNKMGEEVKIIIGTRKISEGLDFKRLRQVHVLEPWYNMARIDQLVGRAVRNCSHVDLPLSMRNVEVFFYSVEAPNKNDQKCETVDSRYYRRAENKDVRIKKVETVLRSVAIDCVFNKNANIFEKGVYVDAITSSGEKRKIAIGDEPNTRDCNYQSNCDYQCEWEPLPGKHYPINKDTYNLRFAKSNIEQASKYIKELFRKDVIYDLSRIVRYICGKANKSIENIFIYKALHNYVMDKNEVVYDKYGRKGNLIYRGKYYIFQPAELNYKKMPVYYRRVPLTEKPDEFSIEDINNNNDVNVTNNKNNNINVNIVGNTVTAIKKLEKEIDPFISKNKDSLQIIANMVIDRYKKKQRILLLVRIVALHFANKKGIDAYHDVILKHFNEDLFIKCRDLYYDDPKHKSDDSIFGYQVKGEMYCWNGKDFDVCDSKTKDTIALNQKLRKGKQTNKKTSKIVGFMEEMRSGKMEFKIKDYTIETGAITAKGVESKRAKVRGRVCSTYKRTEQEILMGKLKIPYDPEMRIKDACNLIEYTIRSRNCLVNE